jgi:hypothetical protein
MKSLFTVVLTLLLSFAALAQTPGQASGSPVVSSGMHEQNVQTATTNGQMLMFLDPIGSLTASFEYSFQGTAPSTTSITIQGCGLSGTCSSTLDTCTTVANTIRQVTASTGPYASWQVIVSWTGGDATTKVTVSQIGVLARAPAAATFPAAVGTPITLTGQTAAIGTTNLLTNAPAGMYRASFYLVTSHVSGNSTSVSVTLNWTDTVQAQSQPSLFGTSLQILGDESTGNVFPLVIAQGTTISFSTQLSGAVGTGVYSLYAQLERIR